jgi:hypothetical protein
MEHSKAIDQSTTEAAKPAGLNHGNDGRPKGSDTRFKVGNPGKPKGARHKTTVAVEALLEGQAEALTLKLIEKALAGDPMALRLCFDRIAPVRKGRTFEIDLPVVKTAADATIAMAGLARAVAEGEITTDEAGGVAALLEAWWRNNDVAEMEARVAALEAKQR